MEQINNDEANPSELAKKATVYLFINAGLVNLIWWFIFMFGTHITSKKADFFNEVIAPNLSNLYTWCMVSGLLLLIIGVVILKSGMLIGKKISVVAIWLSIISPLFVALYYFLLFLNKKADIPNLIVISMAIGIAYFHFIKGRPIIK